MKENNCNFMEPLIDTKSLKPGDPIYIDTGYGFQHRTVLKITPTGCVDVKEGNYIHVYLNY